MKKELMYTSLTIMMILMLTYIFFKKKIKKEMNSHVECGFETMWNEKTPFSMNIFMITIMFIILDLEFLIISPINFNENKTSILNSSFFMIMMILTITLILEQNKEMNKWMM